MIKKIEYNQDFKKMGGKGIYEYEMTLIRDFFASEHENMRLEYSSKKEAVNATVQIKKYVEREKVNVNVHQREQYIFILRREKCTKDGK